MKDSATSFASGTKSLAIGMATGNIEIYNPGSCQWSGPSAITSVVILKLDDSNHLLASCSTSTIHLWDHNGLESWSDRLDSRCVELILRDTSLIGVFMSGHVTTWNLKTGEAIVDPTFTSIGNPMMMNLAELSLRLLVRLRYLPVFKYSHSAP